MTFRFNSILADEAEPISPKDVALLRHQDSRAVRGRTPYELWRDDTARWDLYQSTQRPRNRTALGRPYWASFVVSPNGRTMFAGLYRATHIGPNEQDLPWPHAEGVDPAGTVERYELLRQERMSDLVGRLFIEWGDGTRAWIQRADRQNKLVTELTAAFKEPDFPGFLKLIAPLSKVGVFPPDWKQRLVEARGVYLLTCPTTKEQYVGSASGEGGFIARWAQYFADGHGGNVGLKSREPSDYQISILELAGSAATVQDVLDMERLWKAKLQSREMGLNRN